MQGRGRDLRTTPRDPHPRDVGGVAARLVNPGDTVFIGAGPLSAAVAPLLAGRASAVVTDSLSAAACLAVAGVPTTLLGGLVVGDRVVPIAGGVDDATSGFRVDVSFNEVFGVDAVSGLSGTDPLDVAAERARLALGRTRVVLVRPHALGRRGPVHLAPARFADVVVTSRTAASDAVEALTAAGVDVRLA